MHIAEGVLSAPVLLTGAIFSAIGIAMGLRKLEYERIPQVAVLSSTFFIASLIHVPIGLANIHLVLNGLMGLILGWAAFPALLIALFLQAILFGFGGLSVLGINTLNLALPAVLCFYLFNYAVNTKGGITLFIYGCAAGALAISLSTLMVALSLFAEGSAFISLIQLMVIAHLPLMLIEGVITGSIIVFLRQVRPELLSTSLHLSDQT